MRNSRILWRTTKSGIVLRLAGLFLSTVLMTAQNTAPHYHSNCCYPLPPEKMQKIPPEIRAQLTAEKCLIPQNPNVIDDPQPNNAIHGSWAAKGQDDRAVLCLKPDELSVRLFWSGKTSCDDKIVLNHFRSGDGHWDDPEAFLWAAPLKPSGHTTTHLADANFQFSIIPASRSAAVRPRSSTTVSRGSGCGLWAMTKPLH